MADQNAKLSIFATRPAIYAPLYNFITEMMGTVALILLALLIELQVGTRLVAPRLLVGNRALDSKRLYSLCNSHLLLSKDNVMR